MKIVRIEAKNLFGIFNHEIPLNIKEHITIIHGPNGYGKTVLLTLLNALFSSSYNELYRFPFSELCVYFDNKSYLRLKKDIDLGAVGKKKDNEKKELIFELKEPGKKRQSFKKIPIRLRSREYHLPLPYRYRMMFQEIEGLKRIGPETWSYEPTEEKLSVDEVIERFGDELPFFVRKKEKTPDWLMDVRNSIPIRFIEAQRLFSISYDRNREEYEDEPQMIPVVMNYSTELARNIQEKLAEYASLSQSLDRTFPARLVTGSDSAKFTIEELKTKLNELEEKRTRLVKTGLLDEEKGIDLELKKIDTSNRDVLSVYVKDAENKLSVFDEFTNKIDLLIKIINSRFLYKKMSIVKKEGFKFTTEEGKAISPTNLSSGEQHEIVLLYELLFKVKPNSLILIDEPELSLHVVWQQQFLKDLQEITKLSEFDILITTHSPQIIHDRWDLTVKLKGPKG